MLGFHDSLADYFKNSSQILGDHLILAYCLENKLKNSNRHSLHSFKIWQKVCVFNIVPQALEGVKKIFISDYLADLLQKNFDFKETLGLDTIMDMENGFDFSHYTQLLDHKQAYQTLFEEVKNFINFDKKAELEQIQESFECQIRFIGIQLGQKKLLNIWNNRDTLIHDKDAIEIFEDINKDLIINKMDLEDQDFDKIDNEQEDEYIDVENLQNTLEICLRNNNLKQIKFFKVLEDLLITLSKIQDSFYDAFEQIKQTFEKVFDEKLNSKHLMTTANDYQMLEENVHSEKNSDPFSILLKNQNLFGGTFDQRLIYDQRTNQPSLSTILKNMNQSPFTNKLVKSIQLKFNMFDDQQNIQKGIDIADDSNDYIKFLKIIENVFTNQLRHGEMHQDKNIYEKFLIKKESGLDEETITFSEEDLINSWVYYKDQYELGKVFIDKIHKLQQEPISLNKFDDPFGELGQKKLDIVKECELLDWLNSNQTTIIEYCQIYKELSRIVQEKNDFRNNGGGKQIYDEFYTKDPENSRRYLYDLMKNQTIFDENDIILIRSIWVINTLANFTKKRVEFSLDKLGFQLKTNQQPNQDDNQLLFEFFTYQESQQICDKAKVIHDSVNSNYDKCVVLLNSNSKLLEWENINFMFKAKEIFEENKISIKDTNQKLEYFYSGIEWMHNLASFALKNSNGVLIDVQEKEL